MTTNCFSYAEVKINGKDYPINFIDDILLENNVDDALDEFYRIQQQQASIGSLMATKRWMMPFTNVVGLS